MVYKGLAGCLTSGDYSIRGHKPVYLVKLSTSRFPLLIRRVGLGYIRVEH